MRLNGACQVSRLRHAVRAMRKEIAALDLRLGVCAHSLKEAYTRSFHWAACLMSPRELENAFDDKGVTPTTIDACFSNFLQGMVSGFL